MSEKDQKEGNIDPNKGSEGEVEKERKINIEIGRDAEIEALRKEWEKDKQELLDRQKELEDAARREKELREQKETEYTTIYDELEEKRGVLSQIALEQFAKEKEDLLSKIEDEEKRAEVEGIIGDDPTKLESVKSMVGVLGIAFQTRDNITGELPQPGSPSSPPPSSSALLEIKNEDSTSLRKRQFENPGEMVNTIWNIASDPSHPDNKEAKAIQDELWRMGTPWLKKMMSSGGFKVSYCPQCGHGFMGDKCPYCGWTPSPHEREEKVR